MLLDQIKLYGMFFYLINYIYSNTDLFSVKYEDPNYGDNHIFEAVRLPGVM